MTVEQARRQYLTLARTAAEIDRWCSEGHGRTACGPWHWLDVDAASIQLDLATAEDCARKSVAY
jgi:hypothetical protein